MARKAGDKANSLLTKRCARQIAMMIAYSSVLNSALAADVCPDGQSLPLLQYSYLGELALDKSQPTIVLERDGHTFTVQPGTVLDKDYRVETVGSESMGLIYLPGGCRFAIDYAKLPTRNLLVDPEKTSHTVAPVAETAKGSDSEPSRSPADRPEPTSKTTSNTDTAQPEGKAIVVETLMRNMGATLPNLNSQPAMTGGTGIGGPSTLTNPRPAVPAADSNSGGSLPLPSTANPAAPGSAANGPVGTGPTPNTQSSSGPIPVPFAPSSGVSVSSPFPNSTPFPR